MAVYVDAPIWKWQGRNWCHLMADDIDELHRFARSLGIHSLSYQGPPKSSVPHYDITTYERDRAVRLGAIPCSRNEIVRVLRRVRMRLPALREGQATGQVASVLNISPLQAAAGAD